VVLVFGGFLWGCLLTLQLGLPVLSTQLADLARHLPEYLKQTENWWLQQGLPWLQQHVPQLPLKGLQHQTQPLSNAIEQAIQRLEPVIRGGLRWTLSEGGGWITETLSRILHTSALLLLAFFGLLDGRRLTQTSLNQLPNKHHQARWQLVLHDAHEVLQGYIRGQALLALVTGIYMGVVYSLFHVKFAVVLGFWFFLMELIPVVGTWLAIIPGLILAVLSVGVVPALGVWICSYVYQTVKDNLVAPKITGDAIGLHPVWVILAILFGAKLAGLLGILLSLPIAALLQRWLRLWLCESEEQYRLLNALDQRKAATE
jgi:predicted PurR-regulated permease PerM